MPSQAMPVLEAVLVVFCVPFLESPLIRRGIRGFGSTEVYEGLRIRPHCPMRAVTMDAGHCPAANGEPEIADKAPVEELMV